MEKEERKMLKIKKQRENEQQKLLEELNKRQLNIINKKSEYNQKFLFLLLIYFTQLKTFRKKKQLGK